ncbi:UDP-glucose 4-epimerase GalE [Gammaproteobacteria bacterium]|nr:UDP-glucose 4-epimerase GalE [Gammaproteobacteria bacterium]
MNIQAKSQSGFSKKILVTGGAGYIGSHVVVAALDAGYEPLVIDNLSNSDKENISAIEKIKEKKITFYNTDLRNKKNLDDIFLKNKLSAVIHLAGSKSVSESVNDPLSYYDNNINSTLVLLEVMKKYNVSNFIFSSSATVYGHAGKKLISENSPLLPINPYGRSKLYIENIIQDFHKSFLTTENTYYLNSIMLRYFNPVGAHSSGLLSERPRGVPENLMPYLLRVASGRYEFLEIYGDDYPTKDGTGVRDYIHVMDIAEGHVKSLDCLFRLKNEPYLKPINLGSGIGYSVLDMISGLELIVGKKIKSKIVNRRPGDTAFCVADNLLAKNVLDWSPSRDINKILKDVWRAENRK